MISKKTISNCQIAIVAVFTIIGVALGLYISYLIQFKFHFFGATFVTFRDIMGAWLLPLMVLGPAGFFAGAFLAEKL